MAQMFDKDAGTIVDVPDEHVADRFLSGKFGLPKGRVPMLTDTGDPVSVDPADVGNAFRQQYTYESPDAAQHRTDLAEAGEHPVEAALEGGIRGLIPGGPKLLEQLGPEHSIEKQKLRSEANPLASTGGEIGGNVAQIAGLAALTGGLGDVAEGAGAVGKALRFAKAANIAGLSNVASTINERELGDPDANGQSLAVAYGLGSLWGLGGEGLLSLGEKVVPKILSRASGAVDRLADGATNLFGKAVHAVNPDIAAEDVTKAAEEARGGLARRTKEAIKEGVDAKAVDLSKGLDETMDTVDKLVSHTFEVNRPAEVANLTMDHPVDVAKAGVAKLVDEKLAPALKVLEEAHETGAMNYKEPVVAMRSAMKRLAVDIGESDSTADVYDAVRSFRQSVDDSLKFGKSVPNPSQAKVVDFMRANVRGAVKDALSDAEIFGVKSAERNAAVNLAFSQLKTDGVNLMKKLGYTELSYTGRPIEGIKPSKIVSLLRGEAGNNLSVKEVGDYFDRYITSARKFIGEAEKTAGHAGATPPDSQQLRDLLERVQSQRSEGVKTATPTALEALKAKGRPVPSALSMGIAGTALHAAGVPSVALAPIEAGMAAYRALRSPAETLEAFGRISTSAAKVGKAVSSGVKAFLRNPTARESAIIGSSFGSLHGGETLAAGRVERGNTPFERRSKEIVQLQQNPQLQISTLADKTSRISGAAPETTVGVHQTAARGLNFLVQNMPKNPNPSSLPGEQDWEPNDDQIETFERLYTAVMRPMSILEDLKAGTLTADSVGAVAQVYPAFLDTIKTALVSEIADHPDRELDIGHKLGLQMIFGPSAHVDPEVSGDQATYQASIYAMAAQPQPPPNRPGRPMTPSVFAKGDAFGAQATQLRRA